MTYIYWTKNGKFAANQMNEIPWDDLHSPNEETPALIWVNGIKEWLFEGERHRLSGPARIWFNGREEFYLNGFHYEFEEWIKLHPNIDIYLNAQNMNETQKVLWKLKNL